MLARVLMSVGASDSVASAISDKVLAITTNSPTDATVGFRLLSDGTLQVKEGGAYTSVAGEWANPRGSVGHLFNACLSCLLYTSPSPRDQRGTRMPSSA